MEFRQIDKDIAQMSQKCAATLRATVGCTAASLRLQARGMQSPSIVHVCVSSAHASSSRSVLEHCWPQEASGPSG